MRYFEGEEARLGDKVALGNNLIGEIVCSLDTAEFSTQYPQAQWRYLDRGVLVDFPEFGLIHYESAEPDLRLIRRARVWLEN